MSYLLNSLKYTVLLDVSVGCYVFCAYINPLYPLNAKKINHKNACYTILIVTNLEIAKNECTNFGTKSLNLHPQEKTVLKYEGSSFSVKLLENMLNVQL